MLYGRLRSNMSMQSDPAACKELGCSNASAETNRGVGGCINDQWGVEICDAKRFCPWQEVSDPRSHSESGLEQRTCTLPGMH